MIRLGICTSPENINLVAELGFDYVECGFAWLADLSEDDFARTREQVARAPIPVEAANGMLPGDLKIVGPDVDQAAIEAFLQRAFARAQALGLRVVVFGSGGARRVPDGFSHAQAWRQIAAYLRTANGYAQAHGLRIAIEPLRRAECNIMNFVSEATLMASLLELPCVGALGDTHHMHCGHEPYSALVHAGALLFHVHVSHTISDADGRDYPYEGDGQDYGALFATLRAAGYEGRVSIEAGCRDMRADGAKAIAVLRKARGQG